MSAFWMTHHTADSIDTDAELKTAFERLEDYLDIPDQFVRFSPDEIIGMVLMVGDHPIRIAARLEKQTGEERWSHVWGKVGSHLWSVLPPSEELSKRVDTLSRD